MCFDSCLISLSGVSEECVVVFVAFFKVCCYDSMKFCLPPLLDRLHWFGGIDLLEDIHSFSCSCIHHMIVELVLV